jgi:UDP-galactopyranose mutase
MEILIVGAGFAGSTAARTLADAGHKVMILESRNHIAGNAYDYYDTNGILIHKYGPHIFHTNSDKVYTFLSRFTKWRSYEHRVLSEVNGVQYPFPINRKTLSMILDKEVTEEEAAQHYEDNRIKFDHPTNSEEVVLNSIGRKLCDMFYSGYTKKQWALELKHLSAGVAARIPTRTNDDDRYFTDKYQFMPYHGYTAMFQKMLDHPSIDVRLNNDYFSTKDNVKADYTIYTGPIDKYFNYCYGKLPYRSLIFEYRFVKNCASWQNSGTVNYPNENNYTRITEMKKLTGQEILDTSLLLEYPTENGDPFYPIPRKENQDLYKKYYDLSETEENVSFTGRLAEYKYYNMDQVVASALKLAENMIEKFKY